MIRTNQIIALLTTITIIATTLVFAYGNWPNIMQTHFSFELISLLAKVALGVALLIIIFFTRPRALWHRAIIGLVATTVLAYATYGAIVGSLPLGDAAIYLVGTMIAMTEAVEATMPRTKRNAVQLPGFLAKL